jgi:hypothetical protein
MLINQAWIERDLPACLIVSQRTDALEQVHPHAGTHGQPVWRERAAELDQGRRLALRFYEGVQGDENPEPGADVCAGERAVSILESVHID